jgi:hypothetical protein
MPNNRPWFKAHVLTWVDDPTVSDLTDSQYRLFVGLHCLCARSGEDDRLFAPARYVAKRLGMDLSAVEEGLGVLEEFGLVAVLGESIALCSWKVEQEKRTSTDRSREFRKSLKSNATLQQRPCNALEEEAEEE